MNIIWLEPESLLPATTGGRIGSLKRLEQIAKTEDIFLFYSYDNDGEIKEIDNLLNLCKEVHPYSRRRNKANTIKNLFRYPYTVASRCFQEMRDDIIDCAKRVPIDLINVDFPHMCVDLFGLKLDIPVVLNQFNIEWKLYQGIARSSSNVLKKIAYSIDSYRLKNYELSIPKKVKLNQVTFISDQDMTFAVEHGFYEKSICHHVPLGENIHYNEVHHGREITTHNIKMEKIIMFSGKMSYGPNDEAANWFLKEIFPAIQQKVGAVKTYIVGKDPSDSLRKLASSNVIITGFVDSVEPYFQEADLVVIPLLHGGGVKVKLLQAISRQKCIVSTSIGVQGTEYADGKTILVSDNAEEFAELCVKALSNKDEVQNRQKQAYEIFLQKYTWEVIGANYLRLLRQVALKG